jgi:hypothetical protein
MRDGNTGEFLAKGHLEFDPSKRKETKYEDKVVLKDLWGNEIGHAIVDIEQEKLSEKELGFDTQFKQMRREMKQMMRDTNRLFGNFSKRFLGRNYGFDLLDDFRSSMLQDWDQPFSDFWRPSLESEEPRQQQQQIKSGGNQQLSGSQGSQSQQSVTKPTTGTQEDMTRRTQEKKGGVEITEEKPIA